MAMGGPNGGNGPSRRRGLSEEDHLLWAEVVRRTTPLHGQRRLRGSTALPEPAPSEPRPEPPRAPVKRARPAPKAPVPPRGHAEPAPVSRPEPGLDRRTAERLRRGERAPDARIDLHGMTAAAAHAALDAFLVQATAQGARVVLVITGKGGRGAGRGLLRDAVPGWLRAGPHGRRILGIYEAHRRHGGAGALYVYLRKR